MVPNFRITVLECPYDNWADPFTREMFGKMIQLKLTGYRHSYPYGVMPFDASDFVATHLMICNETGKGLDPIMAYRCLTLDRAKTHFLTFPPLALMRAIGADEHRQAIEKIIQDTEQHKKAISYESSCTISPEFRGEERLWDLFRMLQVKHHTDAHIDRCIGGGVIRFKVDRLYYFWGYKDLALNGKPLPPVEVPFVFNELTGFYYREQFSDEALKHAEKWARHWENRVCIGHITKPEKQAA